MTKQGIEVGERPQTGRRGGGPAALIAGLLWPGGGQLVLGDLWSAACVGLAFAFLLLCCGLELAVPNYDAYPAPFVLPEVLGQLKAPLQVVPQLIVGAVFAVSLHVGAAIFASRSTVPSAADPD